jgi:hypothetical protein
MRPPAGAGVRACCCWSRHSSASSCCESGVEPTRSGERATQRSANEEAISHLRRALALVGTLPCVAEVTSGLPVYVEDVRAIEPVVSGRSLDQVEQLAARLQHAARLVLRQLRQYLRRFSAMRSSLASCSCRPPLSYRTPRFIVRRPRLCESHSLSRESHGLSHRYGIMRNEWCYGMIPSRFPAADSAVSSRSRCASECPNVMLTRIIASVGPTAG